MLTKDELMTELLAQPKRIAAQADAMLENAGRHLKAVNALKDAEAALHIQGFDHLGKTNAEQREAHIRAQTAAERDEVEKAAAELKEDANDLERLRNEFAALQSVAALMAS